MTAFLLLVVALLHVAAGASAQEPDAMATRPTEGSAAAEAAGAGDPGVIFGRLFTARHPDSIAASANVTLIYRPPDSEQVQRIESLAGTDGSYRFPDIPTDPEISYVVFVKHFGREYLGAPIQFSAGETSLEYNFLVARNANPVPAEDLPAGDLPAGHPPLESQTRVVESARQNPWTMAVIVLTVLALFALPMMSLWRRDTEEEDAVRRPLRALARDIASLDLRFERGELPEAQYREVRESLFRRLRELASGSTDAARRSVGSHASVGAERDGSDSEGPDPGEASDPRAVRSGGASRSSAGEGA